MSVALSIAQQDALVVGVIAPGLALAFAIVVDWIVNREDHR